MEFLTDPIAWWIDPFVDNTFMRNALWAALLAVLTTSVVGTWVVLRGMTFLGDAFAHGVLPGIALAYIIGFSTTIGALGAALLIVGGIHLIRSFSPLSEETSIGVLFVGFLALAVVIMSTGAGAYSGDLTRFLFGAITGIDNDDLRRQAIAAAISVGTTVLLHRALFVATFDEAQAQLAGMRPKLAHAALLTLLAVAIVSSFEAVGSLLVFAFLVAPAATASLLVRRRTAHHDDGRRARCCSGRGRLAGQLPPRHSCGGHHGARNRRDAAGDAACDRCHQRAAPPAERSRSRAGRARTRSRCLRA